MKPPAQVDRKTYMASREWASLREAVKRRSGGSCERCGLHAGNQTHHLSYDHFGHESLDELQWLCDPCHRFLSGKSHDDPAYVEGVAELEDQMTEIRHRLSRKPTKALLCTHHALAVRRVALLEEAAGAQGG